MRRCTNIDKYEVWNEKILCKLMIEYLLILYYSSIKYFNWSCSRRRQARNRRDDLRLLNSLIKKEVHRSCGAGTQEEFYSAFQIQACSCLRSGVVDSTFQRIAIFFWTLWVNSVLLTSYFFCAWRINLPAQTRAPLTRTEDIASQLEIRGQGQSAHTFMLIQSFSRKPERTMPDFRVTFHRWISKLKIFNFVKV